jgi:hypothetical protein
MELPLMKWQSFCQEKATLHSVELKSQDRIAFNSPPSAITVASTRGRSLDIY